MMIRLVRSLLLSLAGAALSLAFFSPSVARAQSDDAARARLVQHYCHAREIFTGPEADERARILHRFDPLLIRLDPTTTLGDEEVLVALVDSDEINALHHVISISHSLICLPVAMMRFTGGSEGELAFILAHEFGHAYDDECKTAAGRFNIAHSQNPLVQQRACENRADTIGFNLLIAAGYSPLDAAGAFGREEMLNGDTSTGILATFRGLLSNHPITPERIQHLHQLLIEAVQAGHVQS